MKLTTAIDGFLLAKTVQGCSPNTIRNYTLTLSRLCAHLSTDPDLADITPSHIRAFLHQLMTAQLAPAGVAPRPARHLSAKTLRNIHTCLSSLWTWAIAEGLTATHVIHAIQAPQPERVPVEPFTESDIRALLQATTHSRAWSTCPDTQTELPRLRVLRDRAICLFLLDTGVRASELCALRLVDVDLKAGSARVKSKGRLNAGQGKQRTVRFSPNTSRALWHYLAQRGALEVEPDQPLFTDRGDQPLERRYLSKHLSRLGERAGVPRTHAHRFRHTFAIAYLRNGGDVYTLQQLLGHTSLEMVKTYLQIAQADVANAHRRASPVANWRL